MDTNLAQIKAEVYKKCGLEISNLTIEPESKEYGACRFELNGLNIVSRNAKITPKKVGQFVTFWKRKENGPIEPFNEKDFLDLYIVCVKDENEFGQFVFPKSVLIKRGIISSDRKEGKRAFRVYPNWVMAKNKQALKTQKWQLKYFYKIDDSIDCKEVKGLYKNR